MAKIETRTEPMVLNMGPHHPTTHGCFRLVVTLDGEEVVDCEPVIGYLHRGMEKIAENRTNLMYVPYVSRWDYGAGMFNEAVTVNAPEKWADIPVPQRARYIRVIMLELNRIANHLLWLGTFVHDLGLGTQPNFNNLQILPHLLRGVKVADIMAILGSIDIIMGSVDR